jgi:hypothetical protein
MNQRDEDIRRINELTEQRFGAQWRENWAANWDSVKGLPGIISLLGGFGGAPCVISAAGPSLEKALPYMRKYRGRYVHISTDACYKRVRNGGVPPDLTVSADAQERVVWLIGKRRRGDLFAGIPWQHPNYVSRVVKDRDFVPFTEYADENVGNISFWGEIALRYLGGDTEYFGTVLPGSGVTSAAMDIAYSMGCSPIIFVGLDLSWKVDNAELENVPEKGEKVRDINGDAVYTKGGYIIQREYFEYMVPKMRRRCHIINATGAGLRISAMDSMGTADAMRLCDSKLWFVPALRMRHLLEHRKKTWGKDR